MPGQTGLDAAEAIAEEWPADRPLPLLVFVTAYDQYAVQAFEHAAVDYVLKPVQTARLARTCGQLQQRLAATAPSAASAGELGGVSLDGLASLLRQLGPTADRAAAPRLRVIQAAVGNQVHMVPVAEVLVFEAADKYVRVITAAREYLIRTSLRELAPQLDPDVFWQVHRGTLVRAEAIEQANRDEAGRVTLKLRGSTERPVVSRLHAQRFKGM
jgi:DNA-binding LytR/AlgR family response regulator